jgi:hypothetical protein
MQASHWRTQGARRAVEARLWSPAVGDRWRDILAAWSYLPRLSVRFRVLTACLVALLAFGLCHAGDQPKWKFAELEGTWVIVKMEIDGKSLLEKGEKWKVVIKDGKATFSPESDPKAEPILLAKVLDISKKPST